MFSMFLIKTQKAVLISTVEITLGEATSIPLKAK
mgnify:CR=1 FL=1|jgi:hypothetical protein